MRLGTLAGMMALLMMLLPPTARAETANDIDLKLFGDNVTEGWPGLPLRPLASQSRP